ncbi:WG repeat-containing protein [Reichenbachiella carrageenanivorans]|uniref:WG repeat-containing protein n=1 Tax=Reichenbachiella carrageenanivorans TaxID=2979869 RepID=A0ABY6D2K7_9BACT|nr:WG repeat-containing protein [Reichenbachiella carrageenanivorans]UXX80397.1 WG repeat-containing protein [Reichenbachiella carrageenanivorans]
MLCQSSIDFYEEKGKTGLKDAEGNTVIPANYDQLGWTKGFSFPVNDVIGYKQGAWGLISVKNKVITPPLYYSLEAQHKNLIVASIKSKYSNELFYGVISSKGHVVVDFKYHSLTPLHDLIIVSVRRKGKSYYGLLDQQGKELLATDFANISYFKEGLFVFTTSSQRKGIIHKSGTIKVEATLDSIAPVSESYTLIFKSGKIGAIDSAGTVLHKPLYKKIVDRQTVKPFKQYQIIDASHESLHDFYCDSILEISSDLLAIVRNDYFEILNVDFDPIFRGEALNHLSAYRKNVIFKTNDKYQIIKYNGEPVYAPGFDTLLFDESYMYGLFEGQWSIFNKFGSSLSKLRFDSLLTGSNNLIPVKRMGYWGYIDHSGKMAISAKFDEAGVFVGNIAQVNYLGSRRIINQFGEFIGEPNYDRIKIEKVNTALVTKRGRTDLINYRGEVLFQTYNQLSPNFFGYLETTAEGHKGLVSHLGEIILYPEYDSISEPMNRRYAVVQQADKVGLINFKGFWVLPLSKETQEICHVNDGFISIKRNGQYGFVDFGQRLLIANRYEKTKPFTSGLAAVKLNGKWGFIDKKEHLLIQPTYTEVTPFKNGIALVSRVGKLGAIDAEERQKIKIEFDTIQTTTHDFLLVKKEGKMGLFNQAGQQLLQPSYTDIRPTMDDHFIVERRGLSGLIDPTGRYSIPLRYYSIREISHGRYICLETDPKAEE